MSPRSCVTEARVTPRSPSGSGEWLAEPGPRRRGCRRAATSRCAALVELLRDEDVQQVIDRMIVKRVAEPQWGPPIGG